MAGAEAYTYAAQPQVVHGRKQPRYRDSTEVEPAAYPANIMVNRRVVRGNTYAAQILPSEPIMEATKKTLRKTGPIRPPGTPEPVSGRRHIVVQTDTYLEELTDEVPEMEMSTQTDSFMDRPPTPLFVPTKTGLDSATQIEPGDLFDFDFEVEPLLEVLVGKTLEQGLMEVCEEEELAAMRAHQDHFEQIRNAELVATQRMEAAEKRKVEEKERRLAQERARVEREKVVCQKVAASTFARGYLSGIMESVFDKLYDTGFFYDPVEKEVADIFMPWLVEEAATSMNNRAVAAAAVEKVVLQAIIQDAKQKEAAEQERTAALEAARAEEAQLAQARAEAAKAARELREQHAERVLSTSGLVDEGAVKAKRQELEDAAAAAGAGGEGEQEPEPVTDAAVLEALIDAGDVSADAVADFIAQPVEEAEAEGGAAE